MIEHLQMLQEKCKTWYDERAINHSFNFNFNSNFEGIIRESKLLEQLRPDQIIVTQLQEVIDKHIEVFPINKTSQIKWYMISRKLVTSQNGPNCATCTKGELKLLK